MIIRILPGPLVGNAFSDDVPVQSEVSDRPLNVLPAEDNALADR